MLVYTLYDIKYIKEPQCTYRIYSGRAVKNDIHHGRGVTKFIGRLQD